MAALIQFVDSISDDPVVRLDLNDALSWFCTNFKAPPPRLRRSESENSMRDGGIVGSSTYGNRTLELSLTLIEESWEEWAADEMQKLWRELDRPSNFIRYWPEGLEKPVFFRTFRSDVSELEELWTEPIARNIDLEILAEPFALGLRETLGPYVVNNDPAAGSNPCYFDVTGVVGDVSAPALLTIDPTLSTTLLYLARGADRYFTQCESIGNIDTANPGGGPDAAMSGTGTNNFARTTFATNATMVTRISATAGLARGAYRILAAVRRSDATSVIRVKSVESNTTATLPLTTSRILVDLGVRNTATYLESVGYSTDVNSSTVTTSSTFQAARDSGSGTLDWDYVLLIPADEALLIADPVSSSSQAMVVDGVREEVKSWGGGGDPFVGTGTVDNVEVAAAGSFPRVDPGVTTRLHLTFMSGATSYDKTHAATVNVNYWPRYIFVRPSAS